MERYALKVGPVRIEGYMLPATESVNIETTEDELAVIGLLTPEAIELTATDELLVYRELIIFSGDGYINLHNHKSPSASFIVFWVPSFVLDEFASPAPVDTSIAIYDELVIVYQQVKADSRPSPAAASTLYSWRASGRRIIFSPVPRR
ncbi:MAG: hypothetical protein QM764_20435 [Chitinophagaceae bacterium]